MFYTKQFISVRNIFIDVYPSATITGIVDSVTSMSATGMLHRKTNDPPLATEISMKPIDQVLTSLRRIIRAIDLHSKQLVKTASVTGPQLRLLQLIRSQGDATASELSDAMSLSQATVTSILDRLEDRGLIERVRSHTDKRKVHPHLTESGNTLLDKAPAALQDNFVQKFDQLQTWEQHMIISSLQRLAGMMDAERIDASPYLDLGSLDRPADKTHGGKN